jgi:Bifunctional DNA primase/polymerase, N-terminal
LPRYLSWAKFYSNNFLVPLYPGTKYPIYSPRQPKHVPKPFEDPLDLHKNFPTEESYLSHRFDNERVLTCNIYRYNVGVLTGPQRDGRNLIVRDFDLDSDFGSVEAARKWRKDHIQELREFGTRVTFTPSGGIHAWFYADTVFSVDEFLRKIGGKREIAWLSFKKDVRARNGMIAVPPSTFDGSRYFFMDEGRQEIRELLPVPTPAPFSPRARGWDDDLRELFGESGSNPLR